MFMSKQRAFTLVEMFIVLALLAIFAQVAVPAFQDFIEANQQQALQEQIVRAVQNARTHAVTHRIQVELCGSRDGIVCHNDWSEGWLLREVKQTTPLHITRLDSSKKRLQ